MTRPPETISEAQLHALGSDLLIWANSEGKGNTQFVRWYYVKHGLTKDDWRNLKKRESFRPYHELAMNMMAENITLNDNVAQSYGNRYLCYYDKDLLDHEEAIKDRDAARSKKDKVEVSMEEWLKLQALLSSLGKPTSENT
jgi:hypothetical protein